MKISDVYIGKILEEANAILETMLGLPECTKTERRGGYLCIVQKSTGLFLLLALVGVIEDLKFARNCCQIARLKTAMLLIDPSRLSTHAMRNPHLGFYGGAISLPDVDLDIAFSGSDEFGDEALVTALATKFNWLKVETASRIMSLSSNPITIPLLRSLNLQH